MDLASPCIHGYAPLHHSISQVMHAYPKPHHSPATGKVRYRLPMSTTCRHSASDTERVRHGPGSLGWLTARPMPVLTGRMSCIRVGKLVPVRCDNMIHSSPWVAQDGQWTACSMCVRGHDGQKFGEYVLGWGTYSEGKDRDGH